MHLCRLNWTGRTLPYRHRIRIPTPGGLRASTLLLGHRGSLKYWILTSEQRRNIFFFKSWIPERGIRLKAPIPGTGIRPNHYTRAPALKRLKCWRIVLYLKVIGPTSCQYRVYVTYIHYFHLHFKWLLQRCYIPFLSTLFDIHTIDLLF